MKQRTDSRKKRKARLCFSIVVGVGGFGLLALFFWAECGLFRCTSGAEEKPSDAGTAAEWDSDALSVEELEQVLRAGQLAAQEKLTPKPTEAPKATETPRPTEPSVSKPTEAAEPTETPKPTDTPKPTPTPRPVSDGSYVKLLADTIILGDSLVESISYYRLLDDRHVIAKIGARVEHLRENIPQIVAAYPVNVVLHYGNNSVDPSGSPERVKGFISQYRRAILELQEQMPSLRIYVSGIFPVMDSAYKHSPELKYIGDYNRALRAMCEELSVTYIDNDEIVKAHTNQVEPDGVHMTRGFYQYYWLQYIADIVS